MVSICVHFLLAAPGRPTNLTGSVQDKTSVWLHWNRPDDPNGIILGYQMFYYGYTGNHTEVSTVCKNSLYN